MGRNFSDYEINYLKENWANSSASKIAKILGRSEPAIRQKVKNLNIPNKRSRKIWTKEEDDFLLNAYKKSFTIKQICDFMNRGEASIRLRANKVLNAYRSDRHLKCKFRSENFYYSLKCAIARNSAKAKCCLCDYDKYVDLHHIDGNRKNHLIDNIASLCPNHHREVEAGDYDESLLHCIWWRIYSSGISSKIMDNIEFIRSNSAKS